MTPEEKECIEDKIASLRTLLEGKEDMDRAMYKAFHEDITAIRAEISYIKSKLEKHIEDNYGHEF